MAMRIVRIVAAAVLFLCSLLSFFLAITYPERAGGRGGLAVTGLLFLVFAYALIRRKRS